MTIDNVPEGYIAGIGTETATVVTSIRGLPDVLATVDGSMLTGRINLDDVKAKNNIVEWLPGVYDADVTFAYPEGIYSSGVTTTVSVLLQLDNQRLTGETENRLDHIPTGVDGE